MLRYARLLGIQMRASLLLALQYRVEFLADGVLSLFWTLSALIPLYMVFQERPVIAGWTYGEALLVSGFFTMLQGVLEGAVNPSLAAVVDHIRKGTLDFVLLKPADAQFLVSTTRFLPWRILNVLAAFLVFAYAFNALGRAPGPIEIALAVAMLALAIGLLYSLWIVMVSAAFYVTKIDNLRYLFASIFDAARWPSTVFKGVLSFVFTFVIPLAVMTTFPAQALLGKLPIETLFGATIGTVVFATVARLVWTRSIAKYTSASS